MRVKGFTLIELLTALAIISLLAALLLPVVVQIRAQAYKTTCLSNERQIGMAFALYTQDYDERFPDFRADPQSAAYVADPPYWHDHFCDCLSLVPGQVCFASLLSPHFHSPQVLFCPADTEGKPAGRDVTSYEYKLWLAQGRSQAAIPNPAGMALVWEQWGYHVGSGHLSEYDRRSAMNIVFADGHARWKRLNDASTARYGLGPDLHGFFREEAPADPLAGMDFTP